MADPKASDLVILKILNGAQAGAEVALRDGTYVIGSGSADDVQLIDISLKPSHARLRLREGTIEIMADAGPLRTAAGIALGPGSEWQAIEPLDVVLAGTTKFALGAANARWATVSDDEPGAAPAAPTAPLRLLSLRALRISAVPALGLVLLGLFAAWVLLGAPTRLTMGRHVTGTPLEQTRAALDQFPFGQDIEAHQEVDGTVYVNGYVENPVERRALANALEATGVQARVRLWVLESLRSDVAALLQTQKAAVSYDLSPKGVLTLSGVILNEDTARHLIERVKDQILGLGAVESRIRTAPILLDDVRHLVEASQLQQWLLLRLDGTFIEVDGALPLDKVDAWVGFLQSYAKTFAKDIGLRSFVQLQAPGGRTLPAPQNAIALGDLASGDGDLMLDVEKLKRGTFRLDDVFVDVTKPGETPGSETSRFRGAGPSAGPAIGDVHDGHAWQADGTEGTGRHDAAAAGPRGAVGGRHGAAGPGPQGTGGAAPEALDAAEGSRVDWGALDGVKTPGLGDDGTPVERSGPMAAGAARTSADPGATAADRPEPAAADNHVGRPGPVAESHGTDKTDRATVVKTEPSVSQPRPEAGGVEGREDRRVEAPAAAAAATDPAASGSASSADDGAGRELTRVARLMLERWRDGTLGTDSDGLATKNALDLLRLDDGGQLPAGSSEPKLPDWFVPLFSPATTETQTECWSDTQLRPSNLSPALFWLDLLSATDSRTLSAFSRSEQILLLEVALNPTQVQACAKTSPDALSAVNHSLYIREIRRNPSFIRFLVRDLPLAKIDVSGVDFGRDRFILTRAGLRMHEGSAPDRGSRLVLVGELGIVVQQKSGLSTLIFDPDMAWRITP